MMVLQRLAPAAVVVGFLASSGVGALSPSSHRLASSRPPHLSLSAGPRDEPASPTGAGPRGESRRRSASSSARTRSPGGRRRARSSGPAVATKRRAPHQYDHTKEKARPFIDALAEIKTQTCNEDAEPYDLPDDVAPGTNGDVVAHRHIETKSLDDLFPHLGLSRLFASSKEFRTALRDAMREDVFDTTPAYAGMSDKARRMLLLPDSSLQGSWRCQDGKWVRSGGAGQGQEEGAEGGNGASGDEPETTMRMVKLTQVLRDHLGDGAPTGDAFMDEIGSLCGPKPSTHWIDIVGVLDRRIPHSWHQDTGRPADVDTKTVLFGFPPEDAYDGVGVFSHVIKLKREHFAADGHPPNEPVLFGGILDDVDDESVVRPRFTEGRELIIYRDVDVLHSSPDVAYRMSVMRFM